MRKLNIILSAVFIFGLVGCTDWLSLKPESEIVLEDYWQSESQATAVLASCYRGLTEDASIERMIVWGELRSDNFVEGKGFPDARKDMGKILDVNINSSNAYADWGPFYSVINYCNTFLHYAPSVINKDQNFTISKLHSDEAEALTIRALCYFYLVRTYKEVPLVLEASINDKQDYNLPKSSERVILDQIIADLLTAQKSARNDYGKGNYNKGRVTLNAVNALLADVYLWDQQYANCVELCNRVINDKTLQLVSGETVLYNVFYKGNSTESIFELQFDKDVLKNNTIDNLYGNSNNIGELSFPIYLGLLGSYSPFNYKATVVESSTDIRAADYFIPALMNGGLSQLIFKYSGMFRTENSSGVSSYSFRSPSNTVNWILYRLSDVILMKAEALVELNRSDDDLREALRMVNTTYLRSNITADSLQFSNYNSKVTMEPLVLRERQRELLFEGKRWFDLMRLARRNNDPLALLTYVTPKLKGDLQYKKMSVMNALYMPIPKSEMDINPKMIQNPYYLDSNGGTSY